MKLISYIRENATELREEINRALNYVPKEAGCDCPKRGTNHYHNNRHRLTGEDIRQWVLNDEGLYSAARGRMPNLVRPYMRSRAGLIRSPGGSVRVILNRLSL